MSEWNVDTLKELMDRRFEAQKEAVQAAQASSDRASEKADRANEKRFDSVNEFRAMVSDQQRVMMPRAEVESVVENLNRRIEDLADQVKDRSSESRGGKNAWAYFVAGVGLLATLLALFGKLGGHP